MIGNSNGAKSFTQYIKDCRKMLQEQRVIPADVDGDLVIDINSPFELIPPSVPPAGQKYKHGILLIHGLFDCPFSLREVGERLCAAGILCRAILLPGHGTNPKALLDIKYQAWIDAVQYGVDSFENDVENLHVLGFSTGATLAINNAVNNAHIKSIITIAPLVRIKTSMAKLLRYPQIMSWISEHRVWLSQYDEIDYARYSSVSINSVQQVDKLTQLAAEEVKKHPLTIPEFMAISNNDQVVSSTDAIELFIKNKNLRSKSIVYTSSQVKFDDTRIEIRSSIYPKLEFKSFSHIALPFSKDNKHYGVHGDYINASRIEPNTIYGAYTKAQAHFYAWLHEMHLMKIKRKESTYNPDFDYMMQEMINFILQ